MLNVYMIDTVVIHKSSGSDKYGEPLPDVEVSVKARVNRKTELIKDIKGENVFSSMNVLLETQPLSHEDFIEVDGVERAILTINKPRDFSWGTMEVFLK